MFHFVLHFRDILYFYITLIIYMISLYIIFLYMISLFILYLHMSLIFMNILLFKSTYNILPKSSYKFNYNFSNCLYIYIISHTFKNAFFHFVELHCTRKFCIRIFPEIYSLYNTFNLIYSYFQ